MFLSLSDVWLLWKGAEFLLLTVAKRSQFMGLVDYVTSKIGALHDVSHGNLSQVSFENSLFMIVLTCFFVCPAPVSRTASSPLTSLASTSCLARGRSMI